MCCDTSGPFPTGNDTYEVSEGPNVRKRKLMEEARNPENVSSNPTLEPHGNGDQKQTMSVGAVLYPATRGR